MHCSILLVTIPPGQPWDKSSPSGLGVGNCLKQSCPGGKVGEANKKKNLLFDGSRKNKSHLHFCMPFTYASSLLSESLEQTTQL